MDRKVSYVFSATGQQGVVSAFRSVSAAAKESKRLVEQSQRVEAKTTNTAARQAATRQAREIERANRAREREEKRHHKTLDDARKKAERESAAAMNREQRALARKHAMAQRWADNQKRQAAIARQAAVAGGVDSMMRAGIGLATGVGKAVIGGGAALGIMATRGAMSLQQQATRAAIAGRQSGEKADPTALRKAWENAAIANRGQTAEDVGAGYQMFVGKTGNKEIAMSMLDTWATTANATGAKIEDLAGVTADLFQKFDIQSVENMRQAFATLTSQGKQGAFELADAASYFPEMAAAANRYGIQKGAEGLQILGGLSQLARPESGSAAETSTAVNTMFAKLIQEASTLKKEHGVDIYEKDAKTGVVKTRDIRDVLMETIAKVGGTDVAKKATGLQEIFDVRGIKAVSGLMRVYNDAVRDGKDGMLAMREKMTAAIDTTGKWTDILDDAAMAEQTTGAKLTGAWEKIQAVVGDKVLPVIADLGTRFADWMDSADFDGFGQVVAAAAEAIGWLGSKALDVAEAFGLVQRDTTDPKKRKADAERVLARIPEDKLEAFDALSQRLKSGEQGIDMTREMAALPGSPEFNRALFDDFQKASGELEKIRQSSTGGGIKGTPKSVSEMGARFAGMSPEDMQQYLQHNEVAKAFLNEQMSTQGIGALSNALTNPIGFGTEMARRTVGRADLAFGAQDSAPDALRAAWSDWATNISGRGPAQNQQLREGESMADFDAANQKVSELAGNMGAAAEAAARAAQALLSVKAQSAMADMDPKF